MWLRWCLGRPASRDVPQKSGSGKFTAVKCRASPKFLEAGCSGASRPSSTVWRLYDRVVPGPMSVYQYRSGETSRKQTSGAFLT